ncbi:copper resistance protein B [Sphingopyxis chilensis]
MIAAPPALAAEQENAPPAHAHGAQATTSTQQPMDMEPNMPMAPGSDHSGHSDAQSQTAEGPTDMGSMDMSSTQGNSSAPMKMGSMQGGRPPADARDPNAHADGYENSTLPGFEKTDQLPISMVLVDQAEFISGNEGDGFAWSAQIANGGDNDKLWLRSQGLKISGERLDPYTGAEALWWHAYSPFWGRTLGVRQDIGRGAHTWLAVGIEGLAPYWFDVELTGYVSDAGHFSARVKASYDMLLTNRLIMTPSAETNIFSKAQNERQLGSGISNVELGLRLRYEIKRKFAPYVGFAWERSFGDTADFKRAAGDPVTERRFVAGVRLWW